MLFHAFTLKAQDCLSVIRISRNQSYQARMRGIYSGKGNADEQLQPQVLQHWELQFIPLTLLLQVFPDNKTNQNMVETLFRWGELALRRSQSQWCKGWAVVDSGVFHTDSQADGLQLCPSLRISLSSRELPSRRQLYNSVCFCFTMFGASAGKT